MPFHVEEVYLEAESDIRNNNYSEALKKYESILYDEPSHAPAHNSLGWLYKNQFDNYGKAENHFLAAIKSDPTYPHAYFHYAVLLTDMERFDDLRKHLDRCLKVSTLDKSWVQVRFALIEELQFNFQRAIQYFEKAILICVNDDKIKEYKQDIDRCRMKIDIAKNSQ